MIVECREILEAGQLPNGVTIFEPDVHKNESVVVFDSPEFTTVLLSLLPGQRVEFPNGRKGDLFTKHVHLDANGVRGVTLYFRMISKIARASQVIAPS